jgi:Domain of unknown function (DUF4340)
MTPRHVGLMLGAAVVLIALAIWLSSQRHLDRATMAGDLVLPGLETALNSVTEVRLTKGDQTRATLKKGASDWTVTERNYPADSGKVRKLLLDLTALDVVEEKTRTPANYPQLGVEDTTSPQATGTRLAVVTPTKVYELIVGKTSSGKSGYVRIPTTQQALLAAPMLTVDADPKHWLDHTLIDVSQDRVKEVEEKPAEGAAYTISREKKEQPDFTVSNIPKGRELSSPVAADPIAGSLGGMTFDDVQKTAPAVDSLASSPLGISPLAARSPALGIPSLAARSRSVTAAPPANAKVSHVTFHTFDGLQIDLAGRKDGTHDLVALTVTSTAKETADEARKLSAQTQGWEYEFPSYKYDAIFRSQEELLKPVEAPPKKADKGSAASKKTDK